MERASLNKRKSQATAGDDSEEDIPLMQRKKPKKESKKRAKAESEEEDDFKPVNTQNSQKRFSTITEINLQNAHRLRR